MERRPFDGFAVLPGMIVTDREGRDWLVYGTSRYAGGGIERVRGLSVRPHPEGGRARVLAEHRFAEMREEA